MYLVFSGEDVWKYTHNAYDFGVFGSTPLTFPIEWHNSKISALAGRVSVPNFHSPELLLEFAGWLEEVARKRQVRLNGRVRNAPRVGGLSTHEKNNQENYDNRSCQTVT